jgi:hypothetical protein
MMKAIHDIVLGEVAGLMEDSDEDIDFSDIPATTERNWNQIHLGVTLAQVYLLVLQCLHKAFGFGIIVRVAFSTRVLLGAY